VQTIALIPDGISRSLYIKECSGTMNVQEQTLVNELNKTLRNKLSKKAGEESGQETGEFPITEPPAQRQDEYDLVSGESQEKEVIRLLLLYGNSEIIFEHVNEDKEIENISVRISDFILQDILNDEIKFENVSCQKIFDEFVALQHRNEIPDKDFFLYHPDHEISSFSIDVTMTPYELSGNWEKNQITVNHESERLKNSVVSAVLAFKAKKIERMLEEVQRKIKETTDEAEQMILLDQLIKLKQTSMMINDQLGRIIIR